MSTHRQYELVYILPPETGEQEVTDLHAQVEQIVARFSGTIDTSENWGRKKLAYEIGPHKEGMYLLDLITGPGDMVKELDRRLKVSDRVVRHLLVRVDDEMRVVERRRAARQAHVTERRAARGLPAEPAAADAAPADAAPSGVAEAAAADTPQAEADEPQSSTRTEVNHE
jgi:small subunit ribosomal protein S6